MQTNQQNSVSEPTVKKKKKKSAVRVQGKRDKGVRKIAHLGKAADVPDSEGLIEDLDLLGIVADRGDAVDQLVTPGLDVVEDGGLAALVEPEEQQVAVALGEVPHRGLLAVGLGLLPHAALEEDVVSELLLVVDHHELLADLLGLGVLLVEDVLLAPALEHALVRPLSCDGALPQL